MNPETPIASLTVAQLQQVIREAVKSDRQLVYGYDGLAELLGCGRSKAYNLINSGKIDDAIIREGRKIIIDANKVLTILK